MTVITIGQSCPSCHHEATSHDALGCVIEGCRCARTRRAMSNITRHIADIVIGRFRAEEPECITPLERRRLVAAEAWAAGSAHGSWPESFNEWWDETGSKL